MKSTIIHNTDKFSVVSYGNGLAYAFINKGAGREVFFQGDDANQFRADLEWMEGSSKSYDELFSLSWNVYSDVSEPLQSHADRCDLVDGAK